MSPSTVGAEVTHMPHMGFTLPVVAHVKMQFEISRRVSNRPTYVNDMTL